MASAPLQQTSDTQNSANATKTMAPNFSISNDGNVEVGPSTALASGAPLDVTRIQLNGEYEDVVPVPAEYELNLGATNASASSESTTSHQSPGPGGLRVLFLSSDTGGGHRASAESLARQFELLFPGSTYELLDLASEAYLPPYNSIVSYYKHLSAHPKQWKLLYGVSNSRAMERVVDTNIKVMSLMCERSMRRKLKSYQADVVVSVHPLMTSVPVLSCAKISHETGKHLPMFTVVTDLGSAHSTWFASGVEKMFVGSQQIYELAKQRKVPEEKLILIGLPIRHDFSIQADLLGDRMSPEGRAYQRKVREQLGLPACDRKTLLVMGGGEGVGSLSNIVDALYVELVNQGIDAVICVVCGRNEKLKASLEHRDWSAVVVNKVPVTKKTRSARKLFNRMKVTDIQQCGSGTSPDSVSRWGTSSGCISDYGVSKSLRRILSSGSLITTSEGGFFVPPSASQPSPVRNQRREEKEGDDPSVDFGDYDDDQSDHSEIDDGQIFKSNSIGAIHVSPPDETEAEEGKEKEDTTSSGTAKMATPRVGFASQTEVFESEINDHEGRNPGKVSVVGLGFVTQMAEYMVAADVLVSKAGPGTISEAAAVSLPVMLTSFLPGQEEGNVDYVVDGKFGAYCHDSDPDSIAETVADWLTDENKLAELSRNAKAKGAPNAARDIVQQIGESALHWRILNETHAVVDAMASSEKADEDSVE